MISSIEWPFSKTGSTTRCPSCFGSLASISRNRLLQERCRITPESIISRLIFSLSIVVSWQIRCRMNPRKMVCISTECSWRAQDGVVKSLQWQINYQSNSTIPSRSFISCRPRSTRKIRTNRKHDMNVPFTRRVIEEAHCLQPVIPRISSWHSNCRAASLQDIGSSGVQPLW